MVIPRMTTYPAVATIDNRTAWVVEISSVAASIAALQPTVIDTACAQPGVFTRPRTATIAIATTVQQTSATRAVFNHEGISRRRGQSQTIAAVAIQPAGIPIDSGTACRKPKAALGGDRRTR